MPPRHRLSIFAAAIALAASAACRAAEPFHFDSPIGIVYKLYHDYSFEAVLETVRIPYPTLLGERRPVLERYLTPNLVRLILADRRCASIHNWGYCNIDFLPIWASQDPSQTRVDIAPSDNAGEVRVTLESPGSNPGTTDKIQLLYVTERTKAGWRIGDIRTDKWSLVAILRGK